MLSIDHVKELNSLEHLFISAAKNDWKSDMPLVLLGEKGSGKTAAVQKYCMQHSHRLYFSFRNLTSDIAPKFFSEQYPEYFHTVCDGWKSFFDALSKHFIKKYHVLVFDDFDDRNDRDDFFKALSSYMGKTNTRNPFVILMVERKNSISIPCYFSSLHQYMPADIRRSYPEMTDEDRVRLYSITDGLTGLISMYDEKLSFDENLNRLIQPDSDFSRHGFDLLQKKFRNPESYSGIMIAISRGSQRLSDIAKFAGYSNKKCETYLQALCNAEIIEKRKEQSEDRRSTTRYYFISGYMALWSRFLLLYQGNPLIELVRSDQIHEFIDKVLVPDHYRKLCMQWFMSHKTEFSMLGHGLTPEHYPNGNYGFDHIFTSGRKKIFVKIWTDLDRHYGADDFKKYDKASVRLNPFYDNIYCLFSIHRFSDSMWKLSKQWDNVHLVEARFLT